MAFLAHGAVRDQDLAENCTFWDGLCRAPHFTFELTPTREGFVTQMKPQLASVLNNDAGQTLDGWLEDSNNKYLAS